MSANFVNIRNNKDITIWQHLIVKLSHETISIIIAYQTVTVISLIFHCMFLAKREKVSRWREVTKDREQFKQCQTFGPYTRVYLSCGELEM